MLFPNFGITINTKLSEVTEGKVSGLDKNLEQAAFRIIASAGEARGKAFEALDAYCNGKFEKIDACLKESGELICEANKALYKLIQKEACGEKVEFSLLLVHACDIMMASASEKELIQRVIEVVEASNKRRKNT